MLTLFWGVLINATPQTYYLRSHSVYMGSAILGRTISCERRCYVLTARIVRTSRLGDEPPFVYDVLG